MKRLLFLFLMLMTTSVFGQAFKPEAEEQCSRAAILRTGERRDAASLTSLKRLFGSGECPESNHELQLALAKRGDSKRLRGVVCSIYASPEQAAGDIRYIGGWFGIRAALLLMEQDQRYFASQGPSSDAKIAGSPRTWGLMILRALVKNQPKGEASARSNFDSEDEQANSERVWRRWITVHKRELQRLVPTGVSVSFEPCSTQ